MLIINIIDGKVIELYKRNKCIHPCHNHSSGIMTLPLLKHELFKPKLNPCCKTTGCHNYFVNTSLLSPSALKFIVQLTTSITECDDDKEREQDPVGIAENFQFSFPLFPVPSSLPEWPNTTNQAKEYVNWHRYPGQLYHLKVEGTNDWNWTDHNHWQNTLEWWIAVCGYINVSFYQFEGSQWLVIHPTKPFADLSRSLTALRWFPLLGIWFSSLRLFAPPKHPVPASSGSSILFHAASLSMRCEY